MGKLGLPFKNIKSYNDSMRKSLNDKLFFLEFLPEDDYTFVDFGCADGSVISALSEQFPAEKSHFCFPETDRSGNRNRG